MSLRILILGALMGRVGQSQEGAFIKKVTLLSALRDSSGSRLAAFFDTSQATLMARSILSLSILS